MMPVYKKNYLKKVVVRLNFSPLEKISEGLPPDISKSVLKFFPISESRDLIEEEVIFTAGSEDVVRKKVIHKQWVFHGRNREKHFFISRDNFSIEYDKHETYEDLKTEFFEIIELMYKHYKDGIAANRLGLRYINHIEKAEEDPTNWTQYLNRNLLCIFDVADRRQAISRALQNLELNYGDMMLRFQYGMHNPDYPSPIKRKIFILDYDGYVQGLQEKNEILTNFENIHTRIYNCFESCITENLKEEIRG